MHTGAHPILGMTQRHQGATFVSEEATDELQGAIAGGFFFGSDIAMASLLTPVSTIAASIAAITIGWSPAALVGTLIARKVGKHHKDFNANQIRHGGFLLWVGKAQSLFNGRWHRRALGAAQKRSRSKQSPSALIIGDNP